MLMNILKNKTRSKHRQETNGRCETYRDKETLLRLEDPNVENNQIYQEYANNKTREPFLPPIYKTENLIPHTNKGKMSIINFGNEKQIHKLSIPKLKRLTFIRETSTQKQNVRARALTDEQQRSRQCGQMRIYHNFVNKKKNKKLNYMSKIIDKVISEDIEPWNLQNSSVFMHVGKNSKQSNKLNIDRLGDYCWQKYVLSDLNTIDRR